MKVLIAGWFGAGNMGDEAILLSEIFSLKSRIEEGEFYILSFGYGRTKRLTATIPEVKKILRIGSIHNILSSDFRGILRAFKEVDIVIIGGGGLFQDIYNRYPVPFFTALSLLARFYRKLLVLYCVGIGPINTLIGKRLCKLVVESADMVSVRDSESRDLLKDFGVMKEIHLSADPVFLLRPQWNERVRDIVKKYDLDGNGTVVGVCVHDLLFWDDKNRETLVDALDTLAIERGLRIVFLPLGAYNEYRYSRKVSDNVDMVASKRIAGRMKGRYSIISDDLYPQELLAVMERMDLIISMRLHGLIMGLTVNVPVIAITYKEESKLKNLMKRINHEDKLFNVCDLEKEKLLEKIDYILSENKEIKEDLKKIVSSLREEIEENNDLLFNTLMPKMPATLSQKSDIDCKIRSEGTKAKFIVSRYRSNGGVNR